MHQLLASADNVNIVGKNISIVKINTEAVVGASRDSGVEVNAAKTMYIFMSCYQNAG
jgi:hypothetical protein